MILNAHIPHVYGHNLSSHTPGGTTLTCQTTKDVFPNQSFESEKQMYQDQAQ